MSGLTVKWQGRTRLVDDQCKGSARPDVPCANPVGGVMYAPGGVLEACEFHMHKSMPVYRREMGR